MKAAAFRGFCQKLKLSWWVRFALGSALLVWAKLAPAATLRRIEIDVVGFGGEGNISVPLIWGHIGPDAVYLGPDRLPRERVSVAPVAAVVALPKPQAAPPKPLVTEPLLSTSFALKSSERSECEKSPRFRALLELLRSMHDRVHAVTWQGGYDWDDCADRAAAAIARLGLSLVREGTSDLGNQSRLIVQFVAKAPTATSPVVAAKAATESPSAVTNKAEASVPGPSKPVLTIDSKVVAVTPSGWFVFQATGFSALELSLSQSGYKSLRREIRPWPVKVGESAGPTSAGVAMTVIQGGNTTTRIRDVELPPTAYDVMFDLATGAGFGYGHHLPREARGSRLALAGAVAKRAIEYGLGARASAAATYSADSAVSSTILVDAAVTITGDWAAAAWQWRVGTGFRYFQSGQRKLANTKPLLIPESVLGPLLNAGIDGKWWQLLLGGGASYVPLYVPGAGLTQTLSPNVSVGYELGKGGAIFVSWAQDTVKYPTLAGHAAIILDTAYLSYRLGL